MKNEKQIREIENTAKKLGFEKWEDVFEYVQDGEGNGAIANHLKKLIEQRAELIGKNRAVRDRAFHDHGSSPASLARSVKGAFYQLNAETTAKVETAISDLVFRPCGSCVSECYRVAFSAGFTADEIGHMVDIARSKNKLK